MRREVVTHALLGIAQIVLVAFIIFVLVNAAPGDPAAKIAGEMATQERIEEVRTDLGLDDPPHEQFGRWLSDAATGDFGTSIVNGESVTSLLGRTVQPTLSLVGGALLIALAVALTAGVAAAYRPHGLVDRAVTVMYSAGIAVPGFFIALVLVAQFAVTRQVFPAVGYVPFSEDPYEWFRHLVLPAFALSTVSVAEITRQLRGSLVDVLQSDYVLSARARGVPTLPLVFHHGLKNAAVPVMTVLGVRISQMVGATVIIESIFNINGLGSAVVDGALSGDIPVVLGVTVFTSVVVLATNIVIDLAHPFFNPKVRAA